MRNDLKNKIAERMQEEEKRLQGIKYTGTHYKGEIVNHGGHECIITEVSADPTTAKM